MTRQNTIVTIQNIFMDSQRVVLYAMACHRPTNGRICLVKIAL